jgi:hypothetical protein
MVFLTIVPVNKSAKFRLKEKETIFYFLFLFFLEEKKKTSIYSISDLHFTVKIHKSNV